MYACRTAEQRELALLVNIPSTSSVAVFGDLATAVRLVLLSVKVAPSSQALGVRLHTVCKKNERKQRLLHSTEIERMLFQSKTKKKNVNRSTNTNQSSSYHSDI